MSLDTEKSPYFSKNKLILKDNESHRFWDKVEFTIDCWNWIASKNKNGYGQFCINNKIKKAHRVSYELLKDKIPKELQIDHLCRNRSCVNPDHLEVVTQQENIRRGDAGKIRGQQEKSKTHCPQGHEYSGENLYITPDGRHRECKTCNRIRMKKLHHKRKLEVLCNA